MRRSTGTTDTTEATDLQSPDGQPAVLQGPTSANAVIVLRTTGVPSMAPVPR